jgi:uncharacterized membrane protein YbaN (DUF454 family)
MNQNVHYILPTIALILAIVGIIKPTYPIVAVAVILLAINEFIKYQ